jgi:protein TonB
VIRRLSTLQIALLISIAVHAAVLALRIADPQGFERFFDNLQLEVILVNARSGDKPEHAQAIAQASLAGGGEAAEGRATSPLPASSLTEIGDAVEETHRQEAQLQEQQQQLLAQVRRELATLPPPDPRRDAGHPRNRDNDDRRRQLMRLLAEIEKRINEENARPKKRFVSPATREEPDALYYNGMRLRIEDVGTRNFPEAHGRKLYGELFMNITVDLQGHVVSTEIAQHSKDRQLDRLAAAIVRKAGPFGDVSPAMRKPGYKLLVFTARFTFSREHGFETTLTAPAP